jgi:uncharacterized membrane protein YedE/YeeE
MMEKLLKGTRIEQKLYYKKFAPVITWECMLVLGIIMGAFISANFSGQFKFRWVPSQWQARVGKAAFVRWITALVGGIIMGFGARWAGGCTSGHGISGTLQLAVSSWLSTVCFFVGGVVTAMLIFRMLLV